jgi:hypothetical protein
MHKEINRILDRVAGKAILPKEKENNSVKWKSWKVSPQKKNFE